MAFEVCYKLKQHYNNIKYLELAIPFKDQPNAWFKKEDKDRYSTHIDLADSVTYVDELGKYKRTRTAIGRYNAYKLQVRNEYMVDNSDIVIATWDGTKGGTANCVNYAKKIGKQIIQIDPSII